MRFKIGIISDTHNVLRDEVMGELKTCDYILHTGDFVEKEIYQQLDEAGHLIAVKGNNDQLMLPEEVYFKIGHYDFCMTHQKKDVKHVDFYVYGHSHRYEDRIINHVHYLNPGSCGRRRFSLPLTYMILYLFEDGYVIERRDVKFN